MWGHGTSTSAGVAIALKKDEFTNPVTRHDKGDGRFLVVDAKHVSGKDMSFAALYVPADHTQRVPFLQQLDWSTLSVKETTLFADWNLVTQSRDKRGGAPFVLKPAAHLAMHKLAELQHFDPITVKQRGPWYTWRNSQGVYQRLDRFSVPTTMKSLVVHVVHDPTSRQLSDHDPVKLILRFDKTQVKTGTDLFRLNVRTTLTPEVVNLTEEMYLAAKLQQHAFPTKAAWWDDFKTKLGVKLADIQLSSKRERKRQLLDAKNKIRDLRKQEENGQLVSEQLDAAEREWFTLHKETTERARFHCRVKYQTQGEKPTKFFHALAAAKKARALIHKLKDEHNRSAHGKTQLLETATRYYQKLYTEKQRSKRSARRMMRHIRQSLSPINYAKMERPLKLKHLLRALNAMQNGKSPGIDGLPAEFWKRCKFLLRGLLEVWQEATDIKQLPLSMRTGVISVLYKKGDKTSMDNYRPITLLTVDYKIIAKAYAMRLAKVIGTVIGPEQRGFIPNRFIGENVVEARLLQQYCRARRNNGAIVLLDFRKAYDLLNRSYLFETLTALGFGPSFITAVMTLHNSSIAHVLINGYVGKSFPVITGVRQGCPLAPLLFALATEPLRSYTVSSCKVKGIVIKGQKFVIAMYADDTNGYVADQDDYVAFMGILKRYCSGSGLELNLSKSKVVMLGEHFDTGDVKVVGEQEVEPLLGIPFGPNVRDADIIAPALEKTLNKLQRWKPHHLSIFGKTHVLQTSVFSHLWYVAQFVNFPEATLKQLYNTAWQFVNAGKTKTRVKYDTCYRQVHDGGVNMPHIKCRIMALRAMWVKRFLQPSEDGWKILFKHDLLKIMRQEGIVYPFTAKIPSRVATEYGFVGQALYAWSLTGAHLADKWAESPTRLQIETQPLFYNRRMMDTVPAAPALKDKLVLTVADIYNQRTGELMTLKELMRTAGRFVNEEARTQARSTLARVCRAVPATWLQILRSQPTPLTTNDWVEIINPQLSAAHRDYLYKVTAVHPDDTADVMWVNVNPTPHKLQLHIAHSEMGEPENVPVHDLRRLVVQGDWLTGSSSDRENVAECLAVTLKSKEIRFNKITTKQVYRLLLSAEFPQHLECAPGKWDFHSWPSIWKQWRYSQLPNNVREFLWRSWHGHLYLGDRLNAPHVGKCPLCGAPETQLHVFTECPHTVPLLNKVAQAWSDWTQEHAVGSRLYYFMEMKTKFSNQLRHWVAGTLFHIWKAVCTARFQNEVLPEQAILEQVHSWMRHQISVMRRTAAANELPNWSLNGHWMKDGKVTL
jgi:hypothetical protein